MRERLPLTALRALDAAARNRSLTGAAAELGVTRPAVSKQIRLLEQIMRCPLIDRTGNAIRLTPAGQDLSQSVGQAFDQVAGTMQRITQASGTPTAIRILVDRDFASSFLAAHIGQFLVLHPGISVEIIAERNGRFRLNEDFSFRIFYGVPGGHPGDGLREHELCRWFDHPVCTPDYARAHVGPDGVLIDAQLLIDANYDVWDDWFRQTGLINPGSARHITHFNETSLCLSAAMSGGGITIGDSFLAFPAIRSGQLVVPFRFGLESAQCYSLYQRRGTTPSAAETAFQSWLGGVVQKHQREVVAFLVQCGIQLIRWQATAPDDATRPPVEGHQAP